MSGKKMAPPGNDILKSAIECFQTGRLADAERLFKSLLAQQPNHVAALNILGVLLASLHRYAEAEPHLRSALKFTANSDATLYNYGIVLKGLGRSAEALEYFSKALAINPSVPDTWNNRGTAHNDLKRYEQAVQDFDQALAQKPDHAEALYNKGNALQQLKRYSEARQAYDGSLAIRPGFIEGWLGLGNALKGMKHYLEALAAYDRALALNPSDTEAWLGRGHALLALDRAEAATAAYERAAADSPTAAKVWLRYGDSLNEFKLHEQALIAFNKTIELAPTLAEGWLGRGNAFAGLDRHHEASQDYDKAISVDPGLAEAWLGRGNILLVLKHDDQALAAYDQANLLKPNLPAAQLGRAHVFANAQRHDEALEIYSKLIRETPRYHEAWIGRGNVFSNKKNAEQALVAYDKAITLVPESAFAWLGRGNVLKDIGRHDEAFLAYDRAYALKPNMKYLAGHRLFTKQLICDWRNIDQDWANLLSAVRDGVPAADPFAILMGPSSTADQLKCAQIYTSDICPPSAERMWQGAHYSHPRIRLGYLSADFRQHPVPHLLAGMFERHDRSKFETIAFSLGPDDSSAMRARLKRAFEHFVDIDGYSDRDAARLICEREVDILVDLTGFTAGGRSEILAYRPAPIQVNNLYPGLTDHIDYVMGDSFVMPEHDRPLFSKSIVYIPGTFYAYDSSVQISPGQPDRAAQGLPETGFVFCAFNNSYKIMPAVFDVWMRLLNCKSGSVLWLSPTNQTAIANLRREAAARGIDPQRLCFAPKEPDMADHLARHRLADLFLDTLPFNAHTTALDALWAGLPILTCVGPTFVGRVAAAFLEVLGTPELIVHSLDEYEALARKLTTDDEMLAAIRRKVADRQTTTSLFDTRAYTRHYEAAYETMLERHRLGLEPAHISIAP